MTQEEINRLRSCYRKDINDLLRTAIRHSTGGCPLEYYDRATWEKIVVKLNAVAELLREVEKLSEG